MAKTWNYLTTTLSILFSVVYKIKLTLNVESHNKPIKSGELM